MADGIHVSWSGASASGAALTTGPLNTKMCDDIDVFVDNSAGTAQRVATVKVLADDQATILDSFTVTVTSGQKGIGVLSLHAQAGTGITPRQLAPGPYLQIDIAAAAGVVACTVVGR